MKAKKVCVFFSTVFPYETTLEREFLLLSQNFDIIYYFPTSIKEGEKPILPENFILKKSLAESAENWKTIGLKAWLTVFGLYLGALIKRTNFICYLKHYKTYISIAARNVLWAKILGTFIKENKLKDAIFYDYWFENATLALAILKKEGAIKKAVCRAHGFDLYDERWKDGRVPYRNFKVKYLDKIFAVSNFGLEYFKEKINKKQHKKLSLKYLGVSLPAVNEKPKLKVSGQKLIISVSNTQEFKRVHLIPELLSGVNEPIKWIHFGQGPCDDIIKDKIIKLPDYIKADFRGNVPNEEIFKFYGENHVDLFVSLSVSEGLPISMMEAVAHAVPVFACNICGIPELINENTGYMFESNDKMDIIQQKFLFCLNKDFNSGKIYNFAKERFDYRKNYISFIEEIKQV